MVVCCCFLTLQLVNLLKVVDLSQAELRDVDLHRVNDGEAAVPVLLGDHHRVSALW